MVLDPRFCGPAAPKPSDEVTIVELDKTWQTYILSPTTFLGVNRPFQNSWLRTTDWEIYRDERSQIHTGCKLVWYQSAAACVTILTAISFLSSNTSTDPDRCHQRLSERYQIPECFWSPTCFSLNGCFGCENFYGEKADIRGHSRHIWVLLGWHAASEADTYG